MTVIETSRKSEPMYLATILAATGSASNPWTDLLFWVALFLFAGFVAWLGCRYGG